MNNLNQDLKAVLDGAGVVEGVTSAHTVQNVAGAMRDNPSLANAVIEQLGGEAVTGPDAISRVTATSMVRDVIEGKAPNQVAGEALAEALVADGTVHIPAEVAPEDVVEPKKGKRGAKAARALEIYEGVGGDTAQFLTLIVAELNISRANAQVYLYNIQKAKGIKKVGKKGRPAKKKLIRRTKKKVGRPKKVKRGRPAKKK